MRAMFVAAAMALAFPAWGQTSWSTDRFTVSTDNLTAVSIENGSVKISDMPYLLGLSNAGGSTDPSSVQFDLAFAPQPGYVLAGEQVTYEITMNVDHYDLPSNWLMKASGMFTVDINGAYSFTRSSDGGAIQYSESYFLSDPDLVARVGASTHEGLACPLGHEADSCGFGGYWVSLDALVALTAITVTPILTAIPEPLAIACWIAFLASAALLATSRKARGARGGIAPQSAQTTLRSLDVHRSKPGA
jgi:hypothetical protein